MSQDYLSNLSNLVRFGMATITLQVYPFTDATSPEDVVASAYPFSESQSQEEQAKVVKADIRIRPATQNPNSQVIAAVHHGRLLWSVLLPFDCLVLIETDFYVHCTNPNSLPSW